MCPKVMNFVGIKKIKLCRVGEDFKLNPLVFFKKGFGSEMENPHR
jgi:hypothetical protein